MLAVFDASGSKHDHPVLIVAGFVSSVNDWLDFDREWKDRLSRDGLEYFHAQPFAQSSGPFKNGWEGNTRRRHSLMRDLVGIIISHAHRKEACVVPNRTHSANMSPEIRKAFRLEAYPLAGRTVAKKVMDYAISFRSRYVPEFVFEDGDLDKGMLMERFEKDGYPKPIFKPKKDTVNKQTGLITPGYTPLQAADLWAYELFLAYKHDRKNVPFGSMRWPFKELDKMQGEAGIYLDESMRRTNSMLDQQRSGSAVIRDPLSGAVLLPHFKQREKK